MDINSKVIIVTGTPGTGKSTISKIIARITNFDYLDVNKIIDNDGICEGYDEIRKCKIVDVNALNDILKKIMTEKSEAGCKGMVIDSHLSHHLDKENVDLCIITKCNLKILEKRLIERGYDEAKVRENLDSEIFDVCANEAEELGHNLTIIDTSEDIETDEIKKIIEPLIL